MVSYLKKAEPASRQDTRALTERVRAMLDDIEANRDEAVRRYARDLDNGSGPSSASAPTRSPRPARP